MSTTTSSIFVRFIFTALVGGCGCGCCCTVLVDTPSNTSTSTFDEGNVVIDADDTELPTSITILSSLLSSILLQSVALTCKLPVALAVAVVATVNPPICPHVTPPPPVSAAAAVADFANDVTISVFTPFGVFVIVTFTNVVLATDGVGTGDGVDIAASVEVIAFDMGIDTTVDGAAVCVIDGIVVAAMLKAGDTVTVVVADALTVAVVDTVSVDRVATPGPIDMGATAPIVVDGVPELVVKTVAAAIATDWLPADFIIISASRCIVLLISSGSSLPQLVVVTAAVVEDIVCSSLHTSNGFVAEIALLLFNVPDDDDDVTDDDNKSTFGVAVHIVADAATAVGQVVEMSVVFVTVVNDVSGVHIDGVTNSVDIDDDGVDIDVDNVAVDVVELLCMLPPLPVIDVPPLPLLVVAAPMAGGDIDGLELIELVVAVADVADDVVEFAARSRPPVFCCCSRCSLKMEKPRLYEDSSESSWGSYVKYNLFCVI